MEVLREMEQKKRKLKKKENAEEQHETYEWNQADFAMLRHQMDQCIKMQAQISELKQHPTCITPVHMINDHFPNFVNHKLKHR